MKKLIAATTISVLMAAGGAFAQYGGSTGADPTAGTEGSRGTAPMVDDSSSMDNGMGGATMVDPAPTGSISTNSNCSPPNGTNPESIPPEQRAPVVQSCNPR